MAEDLDINGHLTLPGAALSWTAVRSSGPGGQHANKASTRVELRLDLDAVADLFDDYGLSRLRALGRRHFDSDGKIMVASEVSRSQSANLDDARNKLAALVRAALAPPPKPRKKTRPSRAAKRRRLEGKRRTAEKKKLRKMPDFD